jgi:hypothetical protein
MITGVAQQQLQATTLTSISVAKGNNIGQSLPLSGTQVETTATNSTGVNIETAMSLADVVRKYDVRNISPRDMAAMSLELYQSGAISFRDHALLSFQPELGPEFNKTLAGTTGGPDAPRDFIAQWDTQLQIHEKMGDVNFANNDRRILNILSNLAALREAAAPA